MTENEFNLQMTRLIAQFGKQAYSNERVKIIWEAVRDLSGQWFHKTVNRFIGEFRHTPLMPDFREEISKEQDRLYFSDKKRWQEDSEAFWKSTYHPEEEKQMFATTKARMKGQVKDDDWNAFMKVITAAALESERKGG